MIHPAAEKFVEFLNQKLIRATYGAVAQAAGLPQRSASDWLGEKCHRASWVVSSKTGEPTGYTEAQKHPSLHATSEIIRSADELIRRMKREPR